MKPVPDKEITPFSPNELLKEKSAPNLLYEPKESSPRFCKLSFLVTILTAPPITPEPYNVPADPPLIISILSIESMGM